MPTKLTVVPDNVAPAPRRRIARKRKTPRPPIEDVFQGLILREVLLADGLKGDLKLAEVAPWLGRLLALPASRAIESFVKREAGAAAAAVAQKVSKAAIIEMFSGDAGLVIVRGARKLWQQMVGDKESTAHSCCRTALCYAVCGDYRKAEQWLTDAEEEVGDLARPNFIRGLILGAQGDVRAATRALVKALEGRARPETKKRIREALAFAKAS